MKEYERFLKEKRRAAQSSGPNPTGAVPWLFDFQQLVTDWAIRKGRAAIFASTGLGKTRMELRWADEIARHSGGQVLVLTHLAVADQMGREAIACGVEAVVAREQSSAGRITITNYDRLHRFEPSRFSGVVLDESSVIKNYSSKTLGLLIDAFGATQYKLAATATPAPNDWVELGTHAEFLGVCKREEMLAEFFAHDGGQTSVWRLKGHAKRNFWAWVASWASLVTKPESLGCDGSRYVLPRLNIEHVTVETSVDAIYESGQLFPGILSQSLSERRQARAASLESRAESCAELVKSEPKEPWVIWCDYNAEADQLTSLLPEAVEVRGSDTIEHKEQSLTDFSTGKTRVLISKPSIAGWGLNWQHCARMAFVGLSDSWESYYQAIRRCWRFGQTRPVNVYVFSSELEGAVLGNIARKQSDADEMAVELEAATARAIIGDSTARSIKRKAKSNRISFPSFIQTRGA